MKSILIVIENEVSARFMLEKSLRFSPETIRVVFFESDNNSAVNIQSTIHDVTNNRCEVETVINSSTTLKAKAETLTQMVSQSNPDMVVVHRPQIGKDVQDFSLIKAILKSTSRSTVLLCGGNPWASKIKIIATLDIVDESASQKSLNAQVLNVAMQVSDYMQAELAFLTVLTISKINDELDISDPHEIMTTKGEAVKIKLENMIKEKAASLAFSTHIVVGVPPNEISSVSQKLDSNLVILGNIGRTGIKGLIVGNTAEKILNRLAVDALIVKQ